MTDREVKTALSALTDGAAAQAGPMKEQVLGNIARKKRQRKQARRRFFATAAAAVVVFGVFLRTDTGTALAAEVKQGAKHLVIALLGPKQVTAVVEGEEHTQDYTPVGKDTAEQAPSEVTPGEVTPGAEAAGEEPPAEVTPGFAIWIDAESYEMVEEDGVSYIRPHGWEDLPDYIPVLCQMAIEHLPHTTAADAAQAAKEDLEQRFGQAEALWQMELDSATALMTSGGEEGGWDALRMRVALVDDGCGGAYRITMQYFLEAAEGHGARFDAMLRTFTVGGAQTTP